MTEIPKENSGNNGEAVPLEVKEMEMKITVKVNEPMIVHFPLLNDKILTYGFLKLAEKTLDNHYAGQANKLIKPKNGIMDFVRRKF